MSSTVLGIKGDHSFPIYVVKREGPQLEADKILVYQGAHGKMVEM